MGRGLALEFGVKRWTRPKFSLLRALSRARAPEK